MFCTGIDSSQSRLDSGRCAHVSLVPSVSCAVHLELFRVTEESTHLPPVFRLSPHRDCSTTPTSAFVPPYIKSFAGQWRISLAQGVSCRRNDFARLFRVAFAVALIGLGFSQAALLAANPEINGNPIVGWNGTYLVGRWTGVKVPVHVPDGSPSTSAEVQIELTAVDADGNRVVFESPAKNFAAGDHLVEGLIKVGRLNGEIGFRLVGSSERVVFSPGKSGKLSLPLKPSTRLIVTVGDPAGFDFDNSLEKTNSSTPTTEKANTTVKIVPVQPNDLSENPLAYDGLTSLVLAGSTELTAQQNAAIRDWVAAGGRLVISLPQELGPARRSLPEWVPVKIGDEPAIVREFGGLEAYSGKNNRVPQRSTLSIPHLEIQAGEVAAATRSTPFLVRVPYGLGVVTVLAMDLTSSPLREWKEVSAFSARLAGASAASDLSDKSATKGAQLSSTGITDLATQLHAVQENFENVHRASIWFVMAWLLGLLILIGPLDYLIVHRILKRPILTWVTFPTFAALGLLAAMSLAATGNGTARRANQLNVINVDVATESAHIRHFVNLYSPTTFQSSIAVEPLPVIPAPKVKPTSRSIWEGVPESTFGGMLRETGLEHGATYVQQLDGQLKDIPIMQWSSKAIVCDSQSSAEGLVECNLKATATGSLTGTILHRFAEPIEDWMIVYQNRVYRQLKTREDVRPLPLPPKQVWRVEQPNVSQRELRPFLTGIMTMATPKYGSRASDTIHQQSAYDPLSLDPLDLVRIITFHEDIGGERYTGLTNQILNDQDLSHLLKLGRAILFGRLNQPLARIQQDGETLQPDRESSFVRVIMPVTKSGELMRELKRVVPD